MSKEREGNRLMRSEDAVHILDMHEEDFRQSLQGILLSFDSQLWGALARGKRQITFEIPASLHGRLPYDPNKMGAEVARSFVLRGFVVSGDTKHVTVTVPQRVVDPTAGMMKLTPVQVEQSPAEKWLYPSPSSSTSSSSASSSSFYSTSSLSQLRETLLRSQPGREQGEQSYYQDDGHVYRSTREMQSPVTKLPLRLRKI